MKNIKRKNNIRAYRLAVQQKSDFTIFLILNIFPLIWVVMSSFKTNREILSLHCPFRKTQVLSITCLFCRNRE